MNGTLPNTCHLAHTKTQLPTIHLGTGNPSSAGVHSLIGAGLSDAVWCRVVTGRGHLGVEWEELNAVGEYGSYSQTLICFIPTISGFLYIDTRFFKTSLMVLEAK